MTTTTDTTTERARILDALEAFANQRPGLEPGNYTRETYRQESRAITAQLHDVRALLRVVRWRESSIPAAMLAASLDGRGRLEWDAERGELDYTTGQYWCVEYRAAVARLLADCLWRADLLAYTEARGGRTEGFRDYYLPRVRREFGRRIAARYF
jgi:hypothetical protein